MEGLPTNATSSLPATFFLCLRLPSTAAIAASKSKPAIRRSNCRLTTRPQSNHLDAAQRGAFSNHLPGPQPCASHRRVIPRAVQLNTRASSLVYLFLSFTPPCRQLPRPTPLRQPEPRSRPRVLRLRPCLSRRRQPRAFLHRLPSTSCQTSTKSSSASSRRQRSRPLQHRPPRSYPRTGRSTSSMSRQPPTTCA